jgi:hypothetical protein
MAAFVQSSMNRKLAKQFATLLGREVTGRDQRSAILGLRPELTDGYCLYNLFGEWKQALACDPPRIEALLPIQTLARFVANLDQDETLLMYSTEEWKSLTLMRGPFEGLQYVTCDRCACEYPSFCQSGFDDRFAAVCERCGDVLLQSGYDDRELPVCRCSGSYHAGKCPKCGCGGGTRSDLRSTYQYFAFHAIHERI